MSFVGLKKNARVVQLRFSLDLDTENVFEFGIHVGECKSECECYGGRDGR